MALNLLRPQQREEMEQDKKSLTHALHNPEIKDKGQVVRQLRKLERQLETQTPKPFAANEIDSAVKQEHELREKILRGMPSQEEMRKSPPGAVGKHMEWEKRTKKDLLKWKEIQLRLNHDSGDPDVANFERYRPKASSLNMDNAYIPGKQYMLPPTSPQYAENFDRIFPPKPEVSDQADNPTKVEKKAKKTRTSNLTAEQSIALRAARSERMKNYHAKRKAERELLKGKE